MHNAHLGVIKPSGFNFGTVLNRVANADHVFFNLWSWHMIVKPLFANPNNCTLRICNKTIGDVRICPHCVTTNCLPIQPITTSLFIFAKQLKIPSRYRCLLNHTSTLYIHIYIYTQRYVPIAV